MALSVSPDQSLALTEQLEQVIARFGEEHGVVVVVSGVEFRTPEVTRSFAYVKNGEALRFGEKARKYGLGEQDYGKKVSVCGRPMKLIGCFPNRPKYPFLVEDERGRRYRVSVKQVQQKV